MSNKRVIILSQGPVPTPEHTKVEGGGLRCWGLAKGLRANNEKIDITIAYHESYKKGDFTDSYEDIKITTWNNETVAELIKHHDSVIVSYCMGELSTIVAGSIQPNQQLVLDCYVPIYVEVSARNAEDLDKEYRAFHEDAGRWAQVLRRGDIFLCASEAQKKYYLGVLSGVGRINPATYGQDLILVVPYGIYKNDSPKPTDTPITKKIGKKDFKKILWFGGIYPWFDLSNLIKAVAEVNKGIPAKLIIVGAKNPFNKHPDFLKRYDQLIDFINSKQEYKDLVVLQDWIKFEDRGNWYLDSDLVVVVNKEGEENKLAWRTRLVDFMWANLPVITNGGDPLGQELINKEAAASFNNLEAKDMAADIKRLLGNSKKLKLMQKNMETLKPEYYWDVVTKKLSEKINDHTRSADLARYGSFELIAQQGGIKKRVSKIIYRTKELPAYSRRHGIRNTTHAVNTLVSRKISRGNKRKPKIIFFAHQLDLSGAPFVFIDVLEKVKKSHKDLPIEFHTFNPAHRDNIKRLNKLGVRPKVHVSKDISFDFIKGDVIVLNTVAHSPMLKNSIYEALEKGKANKLIWYVHEDQPELIFGESETMRIEKLLNSNKITIFIAAKKTANNYRKHFDNNKNILIQDHKLVFPDKYHRKLKASDFEKLRFILPGNMADGRKGQLPIFYAFTFLKRYTIQKDPSKYRDFELTFVGLSNDFLSRQITIHAKHALGENFHGIGQIPHEKLMEEYLKANITICYSLRECLPLFVFEGMITGHPIIRNDSSGMEEQLKAGKNGFLLESDDIFQTTQLLERLLNKDKTKNEVLAKMSGESYKIAKNLETKSYNVIAKEIADSYRL